MIPASDPTKQIGGIWTAVRYKLSDDEAIRCDIGMVGRLDLLHKHFEQIDHHQHQRDMVDTVGQV